MPVMSATDVLAKLRELPEVRQLEAQDWDDRHSTWSRGKAWQWSRDLRTVAIAIVLTHWIGDPPRAIDVRNAIVALAYVDALERADASQLAQDAADALYPQRDAAFDERESRADQRYARWLALDAAVDHSFFELVRGLALDL
jgi:hypothetical protein